ncbi:RagB/SusD family nutrient uptake outer membrane protein [Niabella sp. W65]|nr:RagB/SusD family nutrient uptake outer membrane protein [Niabella sp. W65]MCH7364482.1 RagB/SusD family nutrient uptake outer membrane protein [Niabella sp. W65]ULT40344.1 RagB/SusD family nutrient uptake outer membrane protein [Niabella sp. I65]
MKKIIFYLSALLIIGLPSCKKWETEPKDRVLISDVFDPTDKEAVQAKAYLFGIYSLLPNGFNRIDGDFLDAATDDAVPSSERSNVSFFTNGQLTAVNYPDNNWFNSYSIVRRCNVFLKNIAVVPVSDSLIKRYKAEARFLRAFSYFELLKRYGGVPLIGDEVLDLDSDVNIARSSYADCVSYIAGELDAIKNDLAPGSKITVTDFGRANLEAALALQCRLYLYAASPLFNGGGVATDPQKKILTGYTDYDPSRWDKVIAAAEELIAIGYNKLPAGTGTATYRNVFTTKINTDIIFSKQSANSTGLEAASAPVGYVAPAASNGRTSPTQDFLNAFPNLNGSPFDGSVTT